METDKRNLRFKYLFAQEMYKNLRHDWSYKVKTEQSNYTRNVYTNDGERKLRDKYILERNKIRWARIRREVIGYYSNDKFKCVCCGEDEFGFLSIDHIDGGGNEHRRKIGISIYEYLYGRGYPPGFQTLCYNCNLAKGFLGVCPHKNNSNIQ